MVTHHYFLVYILHIAHNEYDNQNRGGMELKNKATLLSNILKDCVPRMSLRVCDMGLRL